jgi:hypothetical protein
MTGYETAPLISHRDHFVHLLVRLLVCLFCLLVMGFYQQAADPAPTDAVDFDLSVPLAAWNRARTHHRWEECVVPALRPS